MFTCKRKNNKNMHIHSNLRLRWIFDMLQICFFSRCALQSPPCEMHSSDGDPQRFVMLLPINFPSLLFPLKRWRKDKEWPVSLWNIKYESEEFQASAPCTCLQAFESMSACGLSSFPSCVLDRHNVFWFWETCIILTATRCNFQACNVSRWNKSANLSACCN